MDYMKWLDTLGKASAPTLLALAIVTRMTGLWVDKPTFDAMVVERNEWKTLALKATHLAEENAPRIAAAPGTSPPDAAPVPKGDSLEGLKMRLRALTR